MPRHARSRSKTGIYHVMTRGNERKIIFMEDEDREKYIDTLYFKAKEEDVKIYAFCLMDNHVHLLLETVNDNLSKFMMRLNISYANYFNSKYSRVGHLFQDRFRSENVENDAYLLEVIRYIHNNPVKAGLAQTPQDYRWSSYNDYLNKRSHSFIDKDRILDIFSQNRSEAIQQFIQFNLKTSEIHSLDYDVQGLKEKKVQTEKKAFEEFKALLHQKNLSEKELLQKENQRIRNEIIGTLKLKYNLSIRQLERITGVNRGTIYMIYKKEKEG